MNGWFLEKLARLLLLSAVALSGRPVTKSAVSPTGIGDEVAELRADLERRGQEIDALQVLATEKATPWYRSVSSLVSALTLLASLLTFSLSFYWSYNQDLSADARLRQEQIHDARVELRSIIQRLYEIPGEIQSASSAGALTFDEANFITGEMKILTSQALEIVNTIPDYVSSTEYRTIGYFLEASRRPDEAKDMYLHAIKAARTSDDYVAAHEQMATFLMSQGDVPGGRTHYAKALDVQHAYPPNPASLTTLYNLNTELVWGWAELVLPACGEADDHIKAATNHLQNLDDVSTRLYYAQYEAKIRELSNARAAMSCSR